MTNRLYRRLRRSCLLSGALVALVTLAACGGQAAPSAASTVSSSLALSADDSTLWVVNQDADSVSVIATATRAVLAEIPLATAPPAVDPTTMRFDPAVAPRSVALANGKAYVAGEAANTVYVIDAATRSVLRSIPVPAAPVSVAATPDGSAVFVVSHEAAVVTKIDTATDAKAATLSVTQHPWAAAVSADGSTLFVTHLLLEPGVSVIDTAALTLRTKVALADQPQGCSSVTMLCPEPRIPNGVARGLYSVVPRPGTGEAWIAHLLLGTQTPQPTLDFESTVFPTVSTLTPDATEAGRRLLFAPPDVTDAGGNFSDTVSGPHAIAFTPDGKLALVAMAQSEDVMVFDADVGDEVGLVRPLPSALLEGIVVDHLGQHAYVDGRNTHDVTVLSIDETNAATPVAVDGAPIERLAADPMPTTLRHGQRLFYTANSAQFPITTNFWVACASCHLEGGSDAVTWLFDAGPRDTPSNAGGPINTGFLLRQALRNEVVDYDETIQLEQGGSYDRTIPADLPDLNALSDFVNYAIPFPQNPNRAADGQLTASQQRGQVTFGSLCASCHTGPYFTDSGAGNPTLDLGGPILLHDIGTCDTAGAFPDQTSLDIAGDQHAACAFDTPTLRGIFATPPYLHDGSAATLLDVVNRLSFSAGLPDAAKADLVAYLETL